MAVSDNNRQSNMERGMRDEFAEEGYHPLDLVVEQKKRISELEAENRRMREALINRDLSADLIAQIISDDARVEDGKVANVAYLAVKIAETIEQKP